MTNISTIVLKKDPARGLLAIVDRAVAEDLRECLSESEIHFTEAEAVTGAQTVISTKSIFVLGNIHPHGVRAVLEENDLKVEIDPCMILSESSYHAPVDQLLRLGEEWHQRTRSDYESMGLNREHVPELIRMALDLELRTAPSGSQIDLAPCHAWWALAELQAEEAVVPLMTLLRRVDEDEAPSPFHRGHDFVPPAKPYLAPPKVGRNDPCSCGSGKKSKKCCGK